MNIIKTLTDSIKDMLGGLGSSLVSFYDTIFVQGTGDTKTLTTFAIVMLSMMGISMSFGIVKWIVRMVRNR